MRIADLPVRRFQALYHIGSMQADQKRNMSWEGMGLSVSVHPAAWTRIGKGLVEGPLWQLSRDVNGFLDYRSLSEAEKSAFREWGIEAGLLRDMGYGSTWGTDALFERVGMLSNHYAAFGFAVSVFVEDHTEMDGVWWEDPLDVRVGGSAPRGNILTSRLAEWDARRIDHAPDGALLSRTAARRIPPVRSDIVERSGDVFSQSGVVEFRPRL